MHDFLVIQAVLDTAVHVFTYSNLSESSTTRLSASLAADETVADHFCDVPADFPIFEETDCDVFSMIRY